MAKPHGSKGQSIRTTFFDFGIYGLGHFLFASLVLFLISEFLALELQIVFANRTGCRFVSLPSLAATNACFSSS